MKKSKRKGKSTQDMIGITGFSHYGISTNRQELVLFVVSPTNISVLSKQSIDSKIRHLMMVLQAVPDIEIVCLDSCECFDANKNFIRRRMAEENNANVRDVLLKDLGFFDNIQAETSTARQFMFIIRLKKDKDELMLHHINKIEKAISEQGFEARRMEKDEIKRVLAIYFEATMNGDQMGDVDGENCFAEENLVVS